MAARVHEQPLRLAGEPAVGLQHGASGSAAGLSPASAPVLAQSLRALPAGGMLMTASSPLHAFHLSNLLTYGSLLAGVGAIAAGVDDNRAAAGALIALSVILDTFDGRFAGMFVRTPAQRAIGGQLDSLSDAI